VVFRKAGCDKVSREAAPVLLADPKQPFNLIDSTSLPAQKGDFYNYAYNQWNKDGLVCSLFGRVSALFLVGAFI